MTVAAPRLRARAAALRARLDQPLPPLARAAGRLLGSDGLVARVDGLMLPVGALGSIRTAGGPVAAEVIGFAANRLDLLLLEARPLPPGAPVVAEWQGEGTAVGDGLLGRVVDALGRPVDGLGPLAADSCWPLAGRPVPPLARAAVDTPIETGIRAIDALLTIGRGQRIGLVAGSGVGKTVLLQQLAAGVDADAVVLALIGERGREIRSFLDGLPAAALPRTHIVAVPADEAAPLRLRGIRAAIAAAEALRARGQHALLLVDSLTRIAHAQRDVAVAAGEPVAARGYPASALQLLARLAERAGGDRRTGGAITAILTVLADGDDLVADPVVDAARGVLDGHILLSRAIAARGRFPAIDVEASLSRTMADCVDPAQLGAAAAFRADVARISASRDLVQMGAHVPGADPALDRALAREPLIEQFLAQPRDTHVPRAEAVAALLAEWGA